MTSNGGPVLVLGGTGHFGRFIVASLVRRRIPVRVLSRNAARARQLLGDGVEVVEGDATSREQLASAIRGSRSMVVGIAAATPELIRRLREIERDAVLHAFEEAPRAGVQRVVYLSGYVLVRELIERLDIAFGRVKLEVEAALAASTLDWTILGEAPSMEMFFAMIRGAKMNVPGGGPPCLPTVSPVDVGEIAAEAAIRDDLGGRRFRVTGPEAMSFGEAARRISAVTGKPLSVRKIPLFPLRVAGLFSPFVRYVSSAARLMNAFPQDLAAQVPEDHALLQRTFQYTALTLEMETRRRMEAALPTASR